MAKIKLSEVAFRLLRLIDERTLFDKTTGERIRYWVARDTSEYVMFQDDPVLIGGGGDAAALRSMVTKGLIEIPQGSIGHCYAITPAGKQYIAACLAPHQ